MTLLRKGVRAMKSDSLSKQLIALELIRRENLKHEHPVWNEMVFKNVVNILRDASMLGVRPTQITDYIVDVLDELEERGRQKDDTR